MLKDRAYEASVAAAAPEKILSLGFVIISGQPRIWDVDGDPDDTFQADYLAHVRADRRSAVFPKDAVVVGNKDLCNVDPSAPLRPLSPGGKADASHYVHVEATRVARTERSKHWEAKAKQIDRHMRVLFERARVADHGVASVTDVVALVILAAPLATHDAAAFVSRVLVKESKHLEYLRAMIDAGRVVVLRHRDTCP